MPLPKKLCETCGVSFVPKRRSQRFHSDECRKSYYAKHFYAYPVVLKTCIQCGGSFPTTCAVKQKYCSPECREEAARLRRENLFKEDEMAETVRYQIFISKPVSDKLDEYLEKRFGPGRKPTSAVMQSAVLLLLEKEGLWDGSAEPPEVPQEEY